MSSVPAGWYKDPADTSTQRYWDGEGWVGKAIPADATPPDGPPPAEEPEPPAPVTPAAPTVVTPAPAPGPQPAPPPGWGPQPPPPPGWQPPPGMQPPPGWQQTAGAQPMHPYLYPMPEVRPHGLALAGLGRRLTARLVDIAAVLVLNILVNGYFVYLYWQDFSPILTDYMDQMKAGVAAPVVQQPSERMQTLSVAIVMIATLLWLLYEAPSIASTGQTLGKRLLGIKVVPVEKIGAIGFGRAFTRWARLGMWTLFWWCGIGLIIQFVAALSPVFDTRLRQAWHDKAAATVVVAVPAGAPPTIDATTRDDHPGGPQ
ncbi:RDD family protein [Actinoplanes flavus]|uniref:RDD family protein n=1 Tax=Actinoplanes flavus TaxID=2820290 RepID=A0ABS3UP38_9ACTN|nr:RDD family protein [Actinoplanes flavus]MBO3740525.1 RDD family protein [Actinoplanes flavus]